MFKTLQQELKERFATLSAFPLFLVQIPRDILWAAYLESFPVEEGCRQDKNCNSCQSFIKNFGGLVAINPETFERISIWDFVPSDSLYVPGVTLMSKFVHDAPIRDAFFHESSKLGTPENKQLLPDGSVTTWFHLSLTAPKEAVKKEDEIPTLLGHIRENKGVFQRALAEFKAPHFEAVLELIDQNGLYKGEEWRPAIQNFYNVLKRYNALQTPDQKEAFCWVQAKRTDIDVLLRFRNTSMGTLFQDLAEEKEFEKAILAFEAKVAPTNYKRPTAVVTQKMIEAAQKQLTELGLLSSLERRHAQISDISPKDVIYLNRNTSGPKADDIFSQLKGDAQNPIKLVTSKLDTIKIDDFLSDILPKAKALEIQFANEHLSNLMSLVAPVHADSPSLFPWPNGFSWSYANQLSDAIKDRVKAQGGKVEGELRISLSWFNPDDLDLHVSLPKSDKIYFGNPRSGGGELDVDMNAYGKKSDTEPVENVIFQNQKYMEEGTYRVSVNQFNKRAPASLRPGFVIEVEHNGEVHTFEYSDSVAAKAVIEAVVFTYSKTEGIKIIKSIKADSRLLQKEAWSLKTGQFYPVSLVLNSPNYWEDAPKTGNRHTFFILPQAFNPERPRGIFNEFLKPEFNVHRKVFEVLGSKMLVPESQHQLSGLGFSSTKPTQILVKVEGAFTRTLKVSF